MKSTPFSSTKGTTLTIGTHPAIQIFTTAKSEENMTKMNALFERVVAREKQKGNPVPSFSYDWFKDFDWMWMPAIEKPFKTTIYRFDEDVREGLHGRDPYTYTEALQIVIEAVLAGEVDKQGTGVVAYFVVEIKGNPKIFRFRAWRSSKGNNTIANQLTIRINTADFEAGNIGWQKGSGVCLEN